MNSIIQTILPYLLIYKYYAIFGTTLIAALIFPIPPGTLLMASSAFASQGYLNFAWVLIAGCAGNIIGDNIGYFLARRYGKQVLYKIGFRKILESKKYKGIERRLKENPGKIIFISRFEVFSNLAANIICGLSEVPYGKYLLFESIGEIFQVVTYCMIGYLLGNNWESISGLISRFLLLILLLGALLCVIFWKKIQAWIDRE